ncbi:hypothetical protein BOTBODRAFT_193062 [Botryobasidium botryosum FD-172 SS1]|uniref:Uncharacterized protein n=1 Tax=Botryobasidium botryosum (strain FD-172 SS1) TaxID=930990 RepID=A0A067M3G2_BOTB1|nr:hypothetical protein BOTBODRAFT_193062 [Botryobasidium botryosum FD-172 SS1]
MENTQLKDLPQLARTSTDLVHHHDRHHSLDTQSQASAGSTGPCANMDTETGRLWVAAGAAEDWTARRLAALRRRHQNYLTPLYRHLPNELISYILELVDSNHGLGAIGLLAFLQVTNLWREIALATPRLWARINISHTPPALTEALLRWSKHTPLDIMCTFPRPSFDHTARNVILISLHADRWRSLHLCGVDGVDSLLQSYAPRLEVLSLDRFTSLWLAPRKVIFSGAAPPIRELFLVGGVIPLSSPVYSGLTRLHLGCAYLDSHVGGLILAIEASPGLQSLHLDQIALEPSPTLDHTRTKSISLLHLVKVDLIHLPAWTIRHILSCLITPPNLAITISNGFEDLSLFRGLDDILPPSTQREPITQSLSRADKLKVSFHARSHAWLSQLCQMHGDVSSACVFRFRIWGYDSAMNYTLTSLGCVFPMPRLKSLALVNLLCAAASPADFATVCNNLPSIEELALDGCNEALLSILLGHQYLPRLQALSIENSQVSEEFIVQLVESRAKATREGETDMLSSVCVGAELLQSLSLTKCRGVTPEMVSTLERLLNKVVWDGGYYVPR